MLICISFMLATFGGKAFATWSTQCFVEAVQPPPHPRFFAPLAQKNNPQVTVPPQANRAPNAKVLHLLCNERHTNGRRSLDLDDLPGHAQQRRRGG